MATALLGAAAAHPLPLMGGASPDASALAMDTANGRALSGGVDAALPGGKAAPFGPPAARLDLAHDDSGLRVGYAPPPRPVHKSGPGDTQDLEFVCPEPPYGLPLNPGVSGQDPVIYGCPFRVYDTQWSLGNGALALHHDDHNEVVFTSLHGGASDGRPFAHTRADSMVHTTFTSGDQGLSWNDQPPQSNYEPAGTIHGSDNDVVLDASGYIYATYLYHNPTGNGFQSIIGLYKGERPSNTFMTTAYDGRVFLHTRDDGNMIGRIHLEHLPAHRPLLEPEGPANETAAPGGAGAVGEAAGTVDTANATDERVVAIWHEAAADPLNSTTGLSGWIDAAWTHVGPDNEWERLPEDQLIGPCSAGSNGIAWQGKVYVACVVDRGYADRPRARIGDVDLWEIDIHGNDTRLIGHTDMATAGQPMLAHAVRDDNTYIGVLAWDRVLADDGALVRLEVQTGYAWLSSLLGPAGRISEFAPDLGIQLREWGRGPDDVPLLDAHVTAFEMTDDTFQSIIVYNEWHADPQDVPEPDPEADPATIIRNRLTDYNKFFMVFNECDGPVAGYQAELGTAVDQYNSEQYLENPGVFNEPRDGLFKTRETNTGEELLYFAIGDYGAMQYGAVLVNAVDNVCSPPPPPPAVPAGVAPQALTTASGVSNMMAAAFAVPAAAMVGYMLTVKRRRPLFTTAEDGP